MRNRRPLVDALLGTLVGLVAGCGDETASSIKRSCDGCTPDAVVGDAANDTWDEGTGEADQGAEGGERPPAGGSTGGEAPGGVVVGGDPGPKPETDAEVDFEVGGDPGPKPDEDAAVPDAAPPPEPDAAPPPELDAAPQPELDAAPPEPDAAPPECLDGQAETVPCGLNGRGASARVCVDGAYGPFGPCMDPDACLDGTMESEACGLNGRGQTSRVCMAGAWSDFGPCADPDACIDDTLEARACGLNGRGAAERVCMAGAWSDFGPCNDPDLCRDGMTLPEACGLNGRGNRQSVCLGGRWGMPGPCVDPDVCVDGTSENRACGPNNAGNQSRTCVGGQWGDWGVCPVCVVDELEPNNSWQLAVRAGRRLPVNVNGRGGLTLLPGDEDYIDFETNLINFNLTATLSADPTCGPVGDGGRICFEMAWYTWVQDEELIDPEPIPLQGPICGDLSAPLVLDAGAVAGLAGEPWTSIVLHVYRQAGTPNVPISYRIDVTR